MNSTKQIKTKDEWAARKRHTVTLPSGSVVEIEIPNLPLLIKVGKIPNHLIDAALKMQSATRITREMLEEQHEYVQVLAALTVKKPELVPGDVDDLPTEDVEMLVEFAMRARDMDAVGHQLGGLETLEEFRQFRFV